MSEWIELTAADGHQLAAWRSGAADASRAVVVVQEIFGVNHHMRTVCDRFAAQGYLAIAPALFDRVERGVDLGYGPDDRNRGIELRARGTDAGALADIEAAALATGDRPRGIVGYCWGGTLAWLGATRTGLFGAAVGWYGGGIAATRTETPRAPVQLHFGEQDAGIPQTDVELIRQAQPGVEIFVYPGAEHGFGCDERPSFSPTDATLAQQRTLGFLEEHLGR